MNKYQEAKDYIDKILENPNWSRVDIEWGAIYEIKHLLNKETPIKPTNQELKYMANGKLMAIGYCQKCTAFVGGYDYYCSQCGQRLDWSDNNE